jgi:hypothetical protein
LEFRVGHLFLEQIAIVIGAEANEDAGLLLLQLRGGDAGVFSRAPGRFEEEALLRIEANRVARGHAEEVRIELFYSLDEASSLRDEPAKGARLTVAGTVGRNFGRGIHAFTEQLPKLVGTFGARQPATHPDDGDRQRRSKRMTGLQ